MLSESCTWPCWRRSAAMIGIACARMVALTRSRPDHRGLAGQQRLGLGFDREGAIGEP